MKYIGSKNRISKFIIPIMLNEAKEKGLKKWVEPFVGGGNVIDKIPKEFKKIGIDNNEYLIEMFKKMQEGWIPPDFISEDEWKNVKDKMDEVYEKHFIGFCRLGCSFGADWFGGYARNVKKDKPNAEILNSTTKSYCKQSKNNLLKQIPNLKDVDFRFGDYKEFDFENALIYCDPPYEGTIPYKGFEFNYCEFWEWVRKMSEKNTVFVSEYNAPNDFISVWEGEIKTNIASQRKGAKNAVEKLFKLK